VVPSRRDGGGRGRGSGGGAGGAGGGRGGGVPVAAGAPVAAGRVGATLGATLAGPTTVTRCPISEGALSMSNGPPSGYQWSPGHISFMGDR